LAGPTSLSDKRKILGLFGLSTHKVYIKQWSPIAGVSSYLTVSPFPRLRQGGLLSAALSVLAYGEAFPLGSMVPCVAPTFLMHPKMPAIGQRTFVY